MDPNPQLYDFIQPYTPEIQQLFLDLRNCLLSAAPGTNELIWDNYNAVAVAYSKSEKLKDAFCHLALYRAQVNFGFNRAVELDAGPLELIGAGKLIRHIKVKDMMSFPKQEVVLFIKSAMEHSLELNLSLPRLASNPKSLVMSIAQKKIRLK